MAELIAFFLEIINDIAFWRKKKKRRKFEKENNLSKKLMINPLDKIYLVVLIIGLVIVYFAFLSPNVYKKRTLKKIDKIELMLKNEKDKFGVYPKKLKDIIRNNPLNQNIIYDSWNNEFHYKLINNGQDYELISKGRDRKLTTKDDVKTK